MKPFLGFDLTENKKNEQYNGEELLKVKTTEAQKTAFENAVDDNLELVDKAKLPLIFRIAEAVCGIGGLLLAGGIVRAWGDSDDMTFARMYENVPWIFWVSGALFVIYLILKLIGNKKAKAVLESDEGNLKKSRLDSAVNRIYAELGVPDSTAETDILSFGYKIKNGEIAAKTRGFETTPYNNLIYRVFSDGNSLCLVNMDGRVEIPLSDIKGIKTVKKHITLSDWNKDTPFNKGEYKQYKLTTDNYDRVHCKKYHILEFTYGGEEWGIYFPCYELPVFEKVTGMSAEE